MPRSTIDLKSARLQKIGTLWTHDDNFSRDEVVFNADKFPELSPSQGSLIRIIALKQTTAVRDFQGSSKGSSKEAPQKSEGSQRNHTSDSRSRRSRRHSLTVTLDENGSLVQDGREVDPEKSYIFVSRPMTPDQKSKYPNLQVSLSEKIAKIFGFRNRMQVVVATVDEDAHSASHVEIAFRDEYLARADMWRMSISELSRRTVYRGQKLTFLGTIKATIKNVYINGQSTHSGYFSSTTKPIFRSESARYVLFIQMSKEMWDFDAEGAGEIMFNKVVNGFLPELFKRWMRLNARHLITIILFTRMEYDRKESPPQNRGSEQHENINIDCRGQPFRDYYRVVVSEMASGDWINILYQLKKEFQTFLRDISLVPKDAEDLRADVPGALTESSNSNLTISGTPSTAENGNVLEAINLAAVQFDKDYIDRDLVHTGISIVVITAGTGVFEVDYSTLKLTTDTLVGSGIGIDLVCLSPMPLHTVPLFKYRNPRLGSARAATVSKEIEVVGSLGSLNDPEDKTPRQKLPNFGSLSRKSPAKASLVHPLGSVTTVAEMETDEWKYAMPYWVDISFWSGSSEEVIELSKLKKTKKPSSKPKAKGKPFNLRCRMYELQMMGVMENELGNISIAYMEEDPLYPHALRGYFEDHNPKQHEDDFLSTQKDTKMIKNTPTKDQKALTDGQMLQKTWMDTYDEQLYCPIPQRRRLEELQQKELPRPTELDDDDSQMREQNDSLLSVSFRSPPPAFGQTARPPDVSFHQLMKERSAEYDDVSLRGPRSREVENRGRSAQLTEETQRKGSVGIAGLYPRPMSHRRGGSGDSSMTTSSIQRAGNHSSSTSGQVASSRQPTEYLNIPKGKETPVKTTKLIRPSGWLSKQLSFGGLGFGASKSSAGVSEITTGNIKTPSMVNENNQRGVIAAKLASTKEQNAEKPSQPIAIRTASRANIATQHSPSEHVQKSVETFRSIQAARKPEASQPGSLAKDHGSLFLFAGSKDLLNQVGRKPDLSSSAGGQQIPRTLSPTSALAPWSVLVNPCNARKNNTDLASQFRRWQHVFPKPLRASTVKWKSLCSPAAVPLTNDWFPAAEQLTTEYNESPYKITQIDDEEITEGPKSRESLIRELVAFRLSHGFQVVVGSSIAEFSGRREHDLSNIFDTSYMCNDGDTVFMSVGSTIHQLVCVAGGEVEVKRYHRKPTTALEASAGVSSPMHYRPLIRTALEDGYQPRGIVLQPPRREYNWNYIDTFLAGYHDEFTEPLRFWRARFVLIPAELPSVQRQRMVSLSEDSEEEVRLEGIRKLTQLWQRHRYIPPEERHFEATTKKQKDPNPLAIEYQTRDPSAIVAAGPDSAILADGDVSDLSTALFSGTEQYHTSNIDIKKLADHLQGEGGVEMRDRRWHWRLHYNCFLGLDLTNWLFLNFKDIETREEAVDLGNQLMEKGLIVHVQSKHQFRDGNFFFQIAPEYRAPRPDSRTSWFGMRRPDKSVPSTPLSEGPRTSPLTIKSNKSRPSTADSSSVSGDGDKTPTKAMNPKRTVALSRVMRYDVDPRKRSYRPEIINLHYDRLHNPDNCYHIRIDWMNVTAKLIEDAMATWATSIEKYGLKLVEVPIAEAASITDTHPFRTPYLVKLAVPPPKTQPEHLFDTVHLGPQSRPDKFAYHKAVLRKLNFVLDVESTASFPADVDVTYSWGKPDYRYTQFIHRSGVGLAQITDDGDFLLLANRLFNSRVAGAGVRDTNRFASDRRAPSGGAPTAPAPPTTPGERANPMRSPFASPLARPVQDSSLLHTQLQAAEKSTSPTLTPTQTAEQIKDEIEAFCFDGDALKQFYEDALKPRASPSPRITPVLDSHIPALGLPPSITVREASPQLGGPLREGGMRRQGSEGSGTGIGGGL